ncbi:MAG TPA: hypothetical protein VK731_06845 [Candidatus Cybelea sp.]|jgi:hypothetical protein|nr:hypothetical protein [Candidatus Cybelea sp.]
MKTVQSENEAMLTAQAINSTQKRFGSCEAQARLMAGTGNGIQLDVMPNGQGEFGLDITNPVPADGVPLSQLYLRFLLTPENERPQSKRVGSWETPQFAGPTDGYDLFNSKGTFLTRIYVNAYAGGTSEKAPKGFRYFRPNLGKDDPAWARSYAEVWKTLNLEKEMANKAQGAVNLGKKLDRQAGRSGCPTFKLVLLAFLLFPLVMLVVTLIAHYGLGTILHAMF